METRDSTLRVGDTNGKPARMDDSLWAAFGTMFRWRRFILSVTGVVAIASIVISLLLPKWYAATTRLLPPESSSGGSLARAVLGDLSSAATSLLGGAGGDYTRFLTILTSRTVLESVVRQFDLTTVYETTESKTPPEDAIEILKANVHFAIDEEYGFLSITVLDRDPVRAAAMANYFTDRLNEINAGLLSLSAGNLRRYVEGRYADARSGRDSLLASLQSFQELYGVYDLTAQTEAFFSQVAGLRGEVLAAEIRHEALRESLGPDNPLVQSARNVVDVANRKYRAALGGGERVLPIPQDTVPRVVREYAEIQMEKLIQEKMLEIIAPLLEQARFDEKKTVEAVQVIDPAVPPIRKARPQRSIIVIISTLSAALLAALFALAMDWWLKNHERLMRRLTEAASGDASPRDDT